jgi:hypothetical protein
VQLAHSYQGLLLRVPALQRTNELGHRPEELHNHRGAVLHDLCPLPKALFESSAIQRDVLPQMQSMSRSCLVAEMDFPAEATV